MITGSASTFWGRNCRRLSGEEVLIDQCLSGSVLAHKTSALIPVGVPMRPEKAYMSILQNPCDRDESIFEVERQFSTRCGIQLALTLGGRGACYDQKGQTPILMEKNNY